jgi:hypothetical protein
LTRLDCDDDAGLVGCDLPCLKRHDRQFKDPMRVVKRQKPRHFQADAGSDQPTIVDWITSGYPTFTGVSRRAGARPQAVDDHDCIAPLER